MITVAQALAAAQALGLDRLDAQWLLSHQLQQGRAWLMAHDDHVLAADQAAAFQAHCLRRADGEPLAYLTGERGFHGLSLQVTPAVLVPRPDTETLVDWALQCAAATDAAPLRVLDMGTGSGAIALALAHALQGRKPTVEITATDFSDTALAVAQGNAQRLGLPVHFVQGAWWHAVPAHERFDLVLSNPPYIRDDDPHLPALRHEPLSALTAGPDGLADLRSIINGAAPNLAAGAWLLLEHGWDQADAVAALLHNAGFAEVSTRRDIEDRPRCTGGRWHPPK